MERGLVKLGKQTTLLFQSDSKFEMRTNILTRSWASVHRVPKTHERPARYGAPVGASPHVRSSLKLDGTFLVVEPTAGDSNNDLSRLGNGAGVELLQTGILLSATA